MKIRVRQGSAAWWIGMIASASAAAYGLYMVLVLCILAL